MFKLKEPKIYINKSAHIALDVYTRNVTMLNLINANKKEPKCARYFQEAHDNERRILD